MKDAFSIIILAIIAIVLLDSFGSIASRYFEFKYSNLAILSFAIYVSTSFFITKKVDWKIAIATTAILGIFDATIGWKISTMLKANMETKYEITFLNIFFMACISTIFGFIGSLIAMKF